MQKYRKAAGSAALLAASLAVHAQEAAQEPIRVTVTGSSIKRIDAETAFPITVIKASELTDKGVTSIEEAITSLSMNQQSTVGAANVGTESGGKSSANLRGLGDGRTLVLLNGRRLANHPYDGSSVDLYSMPFAAIDRIEVLRDGASHIYGTDAIAGVINFITKRSVDRTTASAETVAAQHGGALEKRASLVTGVGDLDADGYNIFGAFDYHHQNIMLASQRPYASTGIIPSAGISKSSGTTFPANFFSVKGIAGNPGFATGCLPPDSFPSSTSATCREDYARFVDLIPETRQMSALVRGTLRLQNDAQAGLEYLHSESKNLNHIAPPPEVNLIMHGTSKWYPGGSGGVPAVAGLTGEDLSVSWRTTEGGRRAADNNGVSDRLVASYNGSIAGWDFSAALTGAQTRVTESLVGGYLNDQMIQDGINNGILNPFGKQDAAGADYLAKAGVRGKVVIATARNSGVDARITKDVAQLPAGPLGLAIGTEARHESADFLVQRGPLDLMMISRASGLVAAKDTSGSRSMSAGFVEANAPLTKSLEVQAAVRYDHYSDAGNTTNPKIGFRWRPAKQWMLRGSANSGFRAPTLYELNGPVVDGITSQQYNDPLLCPNGVPKPGVNPNISCMMNLPTRSGGNPELKPEKARAWSFGVVAEPTPAVTLSLDLSKITIRDQIGEVLYESLIMSDPDKYRDRFHYNAAGTALDYVNVSSLGNAGERMTKTADLTAQWRLPHTSIGDFDAWFNGTWVIRDTWTDIDGNTPDNIGVYNGTVRWRHNAAVRWRQGAWSATLSQRYMGSYEDQNTVPDQYKRRVGPWSVWTLSTTYTGFAHLTLTGGIKNLLDKDPPFSNQAPNPQTGYDPRFADPIGRAVYLRATYAF